MTATSSDGQPDPTAGSTPRAILIRWANGQDAWVRRLVGEVLATGALPSRDTLDHLYEVFKAEKGFQTTPDFQTPPLAAGADEAAEEDELVLLELSELRGINALTDSGVIQFNESMTLLFGENGSGKTGYARVLKRLADVRTAEPILGNAHAVGEQTSPQAKLRYRNGAMEQELSWANEAGLPPFNRLSVFDQRAVLLHVDDDLSYVYTPADLALFTQVAAGIRGIQDPISEEVSRLRPAGNPFIARFSRQSALFPLIETLGETTDIAALTAFSELPEDAREQRQTLNEEIAGLSGTQLEERLLAFQQRLKAMASLQSLLVAAARFNPDTYQAARLAASEAKSALAKARALTFEGVALPGPADADWESFVGSAEAYRRHLGLAAYPQHGDRCLYCRQQLSEEARRLLSQYRQFLDDSLRRQVVQSEKTITAAALHLDPGRVGEVKNLIEMWAGAENQPDWLTEVAAAVDASTAIGEASIAGYPLPAQLPTNLDGLQSLVAESEDRTRKALDELVAQRKNRQAALAQRQARLVELEAKMELASQLGAILSHVDRVKQAARFDVLAKRISSTVLRPLTEASKIASEELVNQNFERCFQEESAALRVPDVRLQFQGREGKPERKKIVASHRPSDILSEGEVKVLALADFLAECRLRGTRAPIVFDDPVTSLDYRRVGEVAQRLVKLSESHQVIVLTHNIMLATKLLAGFDDRKGCCTYYAVRDHDALKGFIAADAGPREDTPAKIGKRINRAIQTAGAAEPEVQDALIERGYDLLRSWCEAFVEHDLLGGVARRFEANISMTRLSSIKPTFIPEAVAVLDPLFAKACRVMGGHSQPLEQLSVRPSLTELKEDWASLQALRKGLEAA